MKNIHAIDNNYSLQQIKKLFFICLFFSCAIAQEYQSKKFEVTAFDMMKLLITHSDDHRWPYVYDYLDEIKKEKRNLSCVLNYLDSFPIGQSTTASIAILYHLARTREEAKQYTSSKIASLFLKNSFFLKKKGDILNGTFEIGVYVIPLLVAATECNNEPFVDLLLSLGVNVNQRVYIRTMGKYAYNALDAALDINNADIFSKLTLAGAQLTERAHYLLIARPDCAKIYYKNS